MSSPKLQKPQKPSVKRPKPVPVSLTSPAAAVMVSLVFGIFCLAVTSTMGGTDEYLKGIRFTILFGVLAVYVSIMIVRGVLQAWNTHRYAKRMRQTGWEAYRAAKKAH